MGVGSGEERWNETAIHAILSSEMNAKCCCDVRRTCNKTKRPVSKLTMMTDGVGFALR